MKGDQVGIVANDVGINSAERKEVELLLKGIQKRYGYDFSNYSTTSLMRRLNKARESVRVNSYADLLQKLLEDEKCFDEFLRTMSITVTEMFRNPLFYQSLREKIVPILKTFPFVKIWHAGCATGEEVYSMAIMLHEEGFLNRARIYATDFNKHSLDVGSKAIYRAKYMADYAQNYKEAGGKAELSDYYSDGYEFMKFKDFLKERITFSYHNLVTDGVFGEMNLILCRNVLIYFDKKLQDLVLLKFTDSLRHGGILCLGNKESLSFSAVRQQFENIDIKQRIFKKCGVINGI